MKRILVIYATAGVGHKKASIAIKKALDEAARRDVEVSIVDSLDYTNAFFKWSYLKLYLLMVNRLPLLWGLLYYFTDNFFVNIIVEKIRRLNNALNSGRLVRYVLDYAPDAIVSTHFFASEVFADMKRKGILKSHLITVVTDYRPHSWWVSEHIDTYVVGSPEAKDDLLKWGIPADRIKVIGIPVEPVFTRRLEKKKILEEMGFEDGVFTILAIGGGYGVGPIEVIAKTAMTLPEKVQLIVICGHNVNLKERIERLSSSSKIKMKVLGFVDNVYYFMEAADVLISKSGGITVAESLVKDLPMIVISPIIGQETNNCEFLTSRGAAVKVNEIADLKAALEDMVSNPEKVAAMKEAVRKIGAPNASHDIARLALEAVRDE